METKLEEINRLLNDTQTLQFYETQLTQATGEHFSPEYGDAGKGPRESFSIVVTLISV
jgi:hypothetical protein